MTIEAPENRARGFTMLEVLAALAILAIALVVLIKSQTQSIANVSIVSNYERAVFNTENQLHWTYIDLNEAEDWQSYADLSGDDNDFKWNVHITPVEMENKSQVEATILKILASTTWHEGAKEFSFTLETWYLWGEDK